MAESDNVEHLLADDSFVAWIEGAASDDKARCWETWMEEDPARKKLVEAAISLHKNLAVDHSQHPEMEQELSKLNSVIDRYEQSSNKKANVTSLKRLQPYSSVAAVALLMVTIVGLIAFFQPSVFNDKSTVAEQEQKLVETSTTNGQQKVLTLYDGSQITLNANSSISYPSKYDGGDLSVTLRGEAYFDIERKAGDQKRTFSVNIPGAKVEVLGTEFNINSYSTDASVMLVEGRVSVSMTDTASNTESHIMKPGQLSTISFDTGRITTKNVNADLHVAWLQDKLVFDRASLYEVSKRIANIYNVEFQLDRKELKEIVVSGSLPNDNLDVFLNALEKLLEREIINKDGVIVLGEKL